MRWPKKLILNISGWPGHQFWNMQNIVHQCSHSILHRVFIHLHHCVHYLHHYLQHSVHYLQHSVHYLVYKNTTNTVHLVYTNTTNTVYLVYNNTTNTVYLNIFPLYFTICRSSYRDLKTIFIYCFHVWRWPKKLILHI